MASGDHDRREARAGARARVSGSGERSRRASRILLRDLRRVPRPAACRARPALAVADVRDLAAVAGDRDRGLAHRPIVARSRRSLDSTGRHVTFARAAERTALIRPALEVARGDSSCRGTTATQDASLVRRLRHRAREPGIPPRVARLFGWRPRRLGRRDALGDLGDRRGVHQHDLLRARRDVPGEVRRPRPLRARGVAQVLDARRPDRDVRVLDRVVGGARGQRHLHRPDHPGRVVPERAVRWRVEQPRCHGLLLDRNGQGRSATAHRHRADPRGVALQRPRRTRRGDLRIPRGRAAHGAALRDDDPAVPQRQPSTARTSTTRSRRPIRRGAGSSSHSCGYG